MRKVSQISALKSFRAQIFDLIAPGIFTESGSLLEVAQNTPGHRKYTRKMLIDLFAEQCMVSATVAWDMFISELFVCYINQDCTKFRDDIAQRITNTMTEKFGEKLGSQIVLGPISHLTKRQVKGWLDPREHNMTFRRLTIW